MVESASCEVLVLASVQRGGLLYFVAAFPRTCQRQVVSNSSCSITDAKSAKAACANVLVCLEVCIRISVFISYLQRVVLDEDLSGNRLMHLSHASY
jgi:hypothetical protein